MVNRSSLRDSDVSVFIEAMRACHGLDLGRYCRNALERRIASLCQRHAGGVMGELVKRVMCEPELYPVLLSDLTLTTSEMFRNPEVFRALVEEVFPFLATFASIRVWHAGCSSGEEVYSLAILLQEHGLYERALLYATDLNPAALQRARSGIYPLAHARKAAENYRKAGGRGSLLDYCTTGTDSFLMARALQENLVFSEHNLLSDEVFSEVHLVLSRNVLIYFDEKGQHRAIDLFARSLSPKGYLCLGPGESLRAYPKRDDFLDVRPEMRLFQLRR